MNHKHRKVLHSLFAHPFNANISFREVESVFKELGAEIETRQHNKVHVSLAGHSANFHHVSHSLDRDAVAQIRNFIETCGVDPNRDYPL